MSALPIRGYSPNRQDYIDDPDKFNNPMLGRPLPTPPLNPNRFISVEEFERTPPSPRRPDDGIRMRMEGTLDPSRGTRRPDDVYNRGQAPVEMPMPPAPIATEVFMRPGRGNPNEVYGITVGERVPGMSDGLPRSPQMPATQQQAGGVSFESDYIDWMESKPTKPRRPKGMGAASKSYQKANREYKENLKQWEASKPSRAMYITAPATTAPTESSPPPEFVPPPTETPDKFEGRYVPPTSNLGTPDSLISSNIVGQSYDPGFAARFLAGGTGETNVDAGNGIGMMVMPQRPEPPVGSVFGGYGQQAPMQALAPYAGMAQSQPMPTDFFPTYIPKPDPIYETVPRPEANQPAPQPNAQPVMSSNIPGAIPGNTPGVDFNVFENPMGSYVR